MFSKRIRCDCCYKGFKKKHLLQILDSIYLCNQCVRDIVILYITINPIKRFCAHCPDNETFCQMCNPGNLLKVLIGE